MEVEATDDAGADDAGEAPGGAPAISPRLRLALDLMGAAVVALTVAVAAGRVVAVLRWMVRSPNDADTFWAAVPAGGALLALSIIRAARTQAATADAYVHGLVTDTFPLRPAPPRFAALLAGVGLGVPLGFEGPMVYFGGAAGAALARWWGVRLRWMVLAGGAAGVSMVIGTPLGGALFASEVARRGVPRRDDLPPMVLGALGAGVVLVMTGSPFGVIGAPAALRWSSLLVPALVIGAVCGGLARAFVVAIRRAKSLEVRFLRRAVVVSVTLLVAVTAGWVITDHAIFLGSGDRLRHWATGASVPAVALATLVFAVLVVVMVGGAVTGGLFLPLVSLGTLTGTVLARAWLPFVPVSVAGAVGGATMLAAGYGTPLTAAALLIAATGWSTATAVGAVAIVVASLVGGERSVSIFQAPARSARTCVRDRQD